MAEANEPPEETVVRELREELGLDVVVRGLLVVDWVAPHGPNCRKRGSWPLTKRAGCYGTGCDGG